MTTLTYHLVTRNPGAAAAWYDSVLGAVETSRITLPGDQILTIELGLGDSTLALSDEFPDLGIVSPQTLGGTYGDCTWPCPMRTRPGSGPWTPAPPSSSRCTTPSGGCGPASSSTPSVIAGPSTSTYRDVPPEEVARLAAAAFGADSG